MYATVFRSARRRTACPSIRGLRLLAPYLPADHMINAGNKHDQLRGDGDDRVPGGPCAENPSRPRDEAESAAKPAGEMVNAAQAAVRLMRDLEPRHHSSFPTAGQRSLRTSFRAQRRQRSFERLAYPPGKSRTTHSRLPPRSAASRNSARYTADRKQLARCLSRPPSPSPLESPTASWPATHGSCHPRTEPAPCATYTNLASPAGPLPPVPDWTAMRPVPQLRPIRKIVNSVSWCSILVTAH